ncbi:MAG TPA: DegT/DnrJ/EryC1/StrS family aminotransferase [bacterium]|nr:DegT/DnrJ/EryC1/StrS family aminotransferase [bacterium]
MISVFGSLVGKEEIEEISSSIQNQWMGLGPKVGRFESEFSSRLGLSGLVMVDCGTNALYLAIKTLGIPPGHEIIMPAFTWIGCAQAVRLNGLVPIFCDVDLETQNVTAQTIAPHISSKTAAIMVVHYAGKPVAMKEVMDLGFPVIEDAAHAVDSKLDGQYCGNLGTIGIYSFDAVKNLATPESGGLTSRNSHYLELARELRYCGIAKSGFEAKDTSKKRWWQYHVRDICPKMLPNDIVASVGLAQLKRLDDNQQYRAKIWQFYQHELASVGWLRTPVDAAENEQHSYFTYTIRVINNRRDELAKYLLDRGIYTTLRYEPLHLLPIYKSQSKLPISEQLNEEALSIPLHPRLTENDVQYIVDNIKSFPG